MNGGARDADWVERFRREHGRAPRVLHVGNIANNGYNNAKVLNEAGVECDVICYDYHHIMGCPEWEDADFVGTIEDHFHPAWEDVDLRGFERPRWFAQGPVRWCMHYLVARRRGSRRAGMWWKLLSLHDRSKVDRLGRLFARGYWWVQMKAAAVRYRLQVLRCRCHDALDPYPPLGGWTLRAVLRRILRVPVAATYCLGFEAVRLPWLAAVTIVAGPRDAAPPPATIIEHFDELFPRRDDRLVAADMLQYQTLLPLWRTLFEQYDIIEAYSTDPMLPLIAGKRPYVCYEHGTLREIPFEATAVGRLTALSYRLADGVIITNPDCEQAARRLGIENAVFIPHLIDRKYYDADIKDVDELPPGVRRPYVFCPARHDWAEKGTDILLDAFARIAEDFADLQLVTSSWGGDLDRSRAFIAERGLAERVVLVDPLNIHGLIRTAGQAEALVDQFRYGVFGGIGPTALAVGTPLITHLDHAKSAWCMEPPPYFEAFDPDSCERALRAVLDPATRPDPAEARAWMERNYWYDQVVDRHLEMYERILESTALKPNGHDGAPPARQPKTGIASQAGSREEAPDAQSVP